MLTILTFYLKLDCDFLCEVRGQFSFQFYAFSKNVIQHLKYWHFFFFYKSTYCLSVLLQRRMRLEEGKKQ